MYLKTAGRGLMAVLLALAVLIPAPGLAQARGIVIMPMPRPGGVTEVRLNAMRVDVRVDTGVAQVKVEQNFVNHGQTQAEGTYIFPVPAGAALSSFQMTVDGQEYHGELLGADEARRIYEGIVNQNRDPALLQFVGEGALQARVFPIAPGEQRRVTVSYTQVLGRDGDLSVFHFPMGPDAAEANVTVHVDWRSDAPLRTIYSPSHQVAVTRSGERAAVIEYEGKGGSDFRLYAGGAAGDVGVSLLSYRAPGEDGYFLLIASPRFTPESSVVASKDVVLVLDLSGSMSGTKFEQAKEAARHVLQSLGEGDRFGIVGFHGGTVSYADQLTAANEKQEGIRYVDRLELGGATNIADGMAAAQRMLGKGEAGRPQVILLVTDGLPTAGETDPTRIVDAVRARATQAQRIFTFGVGFDVDTVLLDAMAHDNRGLSQYVKPGENLEDAVSSFWRKVGQPVLADVRIEWAGAKVEEVYPHPLPDLYRGDQIVVTGRYREGGPVKVTLTGQVNGKAETYRFDDLALTRDERSRDFIPRLWAQRKVGYLLGELRRKPNNPEVVDEVVRLSQRYGIVTPYTSFFVPEPVQMGGTPRPLPAGGLSFNNEAPARAAVQKAASAPASGSAAVAAADAVNQLRESKTLASASETGAVRQAGEKTFLYKEGFWVDTAHDGSLVPTEIEFGSKAYFDLLKRHAEAGRWFAAGMPMIVVIDGKGYAIQDNGGAIWQEGDSAEPEAEATAEPAELSAMENSGRHLSGLFWLGAAAVGATGVSVWLRRKRIA